MVSFLIRVFSIRTLHTNPQNWGDFLLEDFSAGHEAAHSQKHGNRKSRETREESASPATRWGHAATGRVRRSGRRRRYLDVSAGRFGALSGRLDGVQGRSLGGAA